MNKERTTELIDQEKELDVMVNGERWPSVSDNPLGPFQKTRWARTDVEEKRYTYGCLYGTRIAPHSTNFQTCTYSRLLLIWQPPSLHDGKYSTVQI